MKAQPSAPHFHSGSARASSALPDHPEIKSPLAHSETPATAPRDSASATGYTSPTTAAEHPSAAHSSALAAGLPASYPAHTNQDSDCGYKTSAPVPAYSLNRSPAESLRNPTPFRFP